MREGRHTTLGELVINNEIMHVKCEKKISLERVKHHSRSVQMLNVFVDKKGVGNKHMRITR